MRLMASPMFFVILDDKKLKGYYLHIRNKDGTIWENGPITSYENTYNIWMLKNKAPDTLLMAWED